MDTTVRCSQSKIEALATTVKTFQTNKLPIICEGWEMNFSGYSETLDNR
jgi:hypothetical protein